MKMKILTLATLALALSPSLMFAAAPAKNVQSTGTHAGNNQYHDRTPRVHEHGSTISPR